jgi:PAS domain S-box-containing protein
MKSAGQSLIQSGKAKEPLVAGTLIDITERKQAEQALAQERDLLGTLMDNLPDYIYFKDRQSRFLRINRAHAKGFGLSDPGQAIGKTDFDFFAAEHAQQAYDDEQEVITTGKPMTAKEEKETWPDGRVTWASTTKMPFRDANGAIIGTFGVSRDITERKQAEKALEERTAYLNTLIEISPVGIAVLDKEERVQMCNPAFERLFLYSRQEMQGFNLDELIIPTEWVSEAESLTKQTLGGASVHATSRRRRKDGTLVDVEIYAVPLVMDDKPLGLLGLYQDITERKKAEEALAQARDLLGTLMDNLPDTIYFKDRESRFTRINKALAKGFGLSDPGQAIGKTDFDFFTAEHAQQAYYDEQEVITTGKPMTAKEEKETWPDGRVTWVSTTKMPFRDANGAIIGTFGVSHDITERKRAEEALRTSEERYRELFENASDLVYTTDLEGRLTSLNRVAEQTLGYSREEAAQMNLRQLVNPRHWQRVEQTRQRLLAGDSAVTLELEITAKDGRRVMLEVNPRLIYKGGKPVGMQGIGRDITGREEREMELRHAQKLESVGRLASGIAHEINTPIQFVGDNTRFVQDSFRGLQTLLSKYQELRDAAASGAVSPDVLAAVRRVEEESDCAYLLEEIPKALTQTLDGVTRVATLVRAMKDFAHPESKEKAAADLNKALLSTLAVARNELKCVADVETDLGDLPPVVCNISDLNQVFLNLLVNAAHAIGDVVKGTGKKGKIQVRTVAEGKTVLVTIADTGCGIPEGIRTKVFDPFFTTKGVGRGTGQGLAIARSVVVERHKGTLTFESEVGKGTSFYVRLPVKSEEYSEKTRVP